MNEFTFSLTTTNPEITPTHMHASTAMRAAYPTGMLKDRLFSSERKHVITTDNDMTAPMERSNVEAQNGMRNANARIPTATFSPMINFALATLRNVSVFQIPKITMKAPHRYKALKRSNPNLASNDFCGAPAGRAAAVAVSVFPDISFPSL